jgi:hypothetical protein
MNLGTLAGILNRHDFKRWRDSDSDSPNLSGPGVYVVARELEPDGYGEDRYEVLDVAETETLWATARSEIVRHKRTNQEDNFVALVCALQQNSDRARLVLAIQEARNLDTE